jgi:DNA-binding CsgD family transcriptional regulator
VAEAVRAALAMAHAVVVLMTPDDVVRLHPDLHAKNETTAETEDSMQARPNVLLELGMALMSHPTTTLVLIVGDQRPVTDLGGVNYLTIADTVECRQKIATRLQAAGCPVDLRGSRWHTAGDFGGLAALRRNPVAQAQPKASDEALDRPAVQSAPEDAGDAPATAASARDVLTVREREVAALVAEGLTNRDIAGRLVVSKRTVDAHVEHIVAKLGLASRVQIANAIRAADEDSPAGTRRLGSTSPTH